MAAAYLARRERLEEYFDRTAADAWAQLTSDAPVSGVRATVRAGRDRMRATLLSWLPEDLTGARLLDAGCGTGPLAMEAAARGAEVVAVDVAERLVDVARRRTPEALASRITYHVGDMLDAAHGAFDFAVSMDSLIHYRTEDVVRAVEALAPRVRRSLAFTFAPRTPALTLMHAAGKLFPRANRSPEIEPAEEADLRGRLEVAPGTQGFALGRSERVKSGFYISQALELVRR